MIETNLFLYSLIQNYAETNRIDSARVWYLSGAVGCCFIYWEIVTLGVLVQNGDYLIRLL